MTRNSLLSHIVPSSLRAWGFVLIFWSAGFLTATTADAQSFNDTGWTRDYFDVYWSPNEGGFADAYVSDPYCYAYHGEAGAIAMVNAHYVRSFYWTGAAVSGVFRTTGQIVGTIGFFPDPTGAYYYSSAGGLSQNGPPDYNVTNSFDLRAGQTDYTFQGSISSHVDNYGHASGQISLRYIPDSNPPG